MQLSYRGSKYEYKRQTSPITVHSNEITGKYRGAEFKTLQYKVFSEMRSPVTLKYRGVSYHLGVNNSNARENYIDKFVPNLSKSKLVS